MHVDYDQQKVTVWGICNRDDVLARIKKKRKESRFWNSEGVEPSADRNGDEPLAASEATEKIILGEGRRNKIRKPWKRLLPLAILLP